MSRQVTREVDRVKHRVVHGIYQDMEETITPTKDFDMVKSKFFNFKCVRSVKIAKL